MYFKNFVVFITVNGKVLREQGDVLTLPFGTEYSINLKNLESRVAVAKVFIDGEDVLSGNELVVQPNVSCELEGFLIGTTAKNKFKFIEKTKQIEDYRGNRAEDGLIRVEFRFKKEKPKEIVWQYLPYSNPYVNPYVNATWYCNDNTYGAVPMASCGITSSSYRSVENSDGITVKGEEISQHFSPVYISDLEDAYHVITLKLVGYKNDKKVEQPFTTYDKIICSVCGYRSKFNSKYCSECGNFLE